MSYTISTHNGSAVSRQHNLRNRKVTDKEAHIDPNGKYEIWHDESPQKAYERIFGKAIADYNARQTRSDRYIQNYYRMIEHDAKKHSVYEMIACIGNMDHHPTEAISKQILREFMDNWKLRNPNLEVIGCYYHADELGVCHIHIDYVPVAHGYKNGMHTQNGLVKALGEMGFEKHGRETAQIQWQKRENLALEDICKAHGLDIKHPEQTDRKHEDTHIYKRQQEIERLDSRAVKALERTRKAEIRSTRLEEYVDQLGCNIANYKRLKERLQALEKFCGQYQLKGINMMEVFEKEYRANRSDRHDFMDR
jgi:IMP cyclohydrolase